MKLIIDIPEEDYIKAKAGILGSLGEIIANGIPYEDSPQGDLIDREALKQAIEQYQIQWNKNCDIDIAKWNCCGTILAIIDNTPTATSEVTIEQAIAKIQETDLLSKHDKMLKEWVDIKCAYCNKNARPQGRWIRYRDNPHQPEHIKCSNCGQYWSIADHDKIFDICFKCGAEMQKGDAK